MKRIGLLLSTAFLASNIAYAESVLTREKLEATTGLSLGYNTSWSSHYVWRGESQSSKDMSPAIGADLGHSSGFYTGVWTGAITNSSIPSESVFISHTSLLPTLPKDSVYPVII